MADKVKLVVAEDASKEFFRRAHERARAMDAGENLPQESVVIVEASKTLREKKSDGSTAMRVAREKRVAVVR